LASLHSAAKTSLLKYSSVSKFLSLQFFYLLAVISRQRKQWLEHTVFSANVLKKYFLIKTEHFSSCTTSRGGGSPKPLCVFFLKIDKA